MTGDATTILTYLMTVQRDKPNAIWELTEKRKTRSLDSNSYFHVLCDKLRQKLGWSMARMKNHLITSYGQPEFGEDGNMVYLKANIDENKMCEFETIHCLPVKYEENATFYRVYRGSHTYNSKEMAMLIQGTQDECLQMDIEVATPEELRRMAALWEKKHEA